MASFGGGSNPVDDKVFFTRKNGSNVPRSTVSIPSKRVAIEIQPSNTVEMAVPMTPERAAPITDAPAGDGDPTTSSSPASIAVPKKRFFGNMLCCPSRSPSTSSKRKEPKPKPNGSVSVEKRNAEQDGPPTYEIVFGWSQSFENLMKHRTGQKYFAEFLKGEYSDENILFWQACEELKREKNAEKIEEKARIIYEDFISILSPKEVSLDSRVREIVNTNMGRPSASTFDEAQNQIYTLMQRDSYPRFLASPIYKNAVTNFGVQEELV